MVSRPQTTFQQATCGLQTGPLPKESGSSQAATKAGNDTKLTHIVTQKDFSPSYLHRSHSGSWFRIDSVIVDGSAANELTAVSLHLTTWLHQNCRHPESMIVSKYGTPLGCGRGSVTGGQRRHVCVRTSPINFHSWQLTLRPVSLLARKTGTVVTVSALAVRALAIQLHRAAASA